MGIIFTTDTPSLPVKCDKWRVNVGKSKSEYVGVESSLARALRNLARIRSRMSFRMGDSCDIPKMASLIVW
jgi:hypothetical protein